MQNGFARNHARIVSLAPKVLTLGRLEVSRSALGVMHEDRDLDSVADTEFGEQAGDVGFDGCFAHEQRRGDISVRCARTHRVGDFTLSIGQRRQSFSSKFAAIGQFVVAQMRQQRARNRRGEHRFTRGYLQHGVDDLGWRRVLQQKAVGARSKCTEHLIVGLERGQHDDVWRVGKASDGRRCGDAVHFGHPNVHQHDIGAALVYRSDSFSTVSRLAHHVQLFRRRQDDLQTPP